MELGEKLRQARMEAGLSQRALCGEEITRNMLSRIENGAARPSMGTLQYLAARLGKPVSYFLEETAVCSPNQAVMAKARQLFDEGDFAGVKQALSGYRAPDETYDRERQLLESVTLLNLAEQAMEKSHMPGSCWKTRRRQSETPPTAEKNWSGAGFCCCAAPALALHSPIWTKRCCFGVRTPCPGVRRSGRRIFWKRRRITPRPAGAC